MEKMKKNKLAIALTATLGLGAFAGSAQAINVSNEGVGQYFYVPYFSVTKGQQELLKLINTSEKTMAVKVMFRRGTDSADIRDFNIIMSPKDVWTGVVEASATGGAQISTTDNTCTVPDKANGWIADQTVKGKYSVPFDAARFGTSVTSASQNVITGFQSRSIPDIREGYVAIAVMGVSKLDVTVPNSVANLAKHDVNGKPKDCFSIDWGFTNALGSVKGQFDAPTNSLSVSAALVDGTRKLAIDVPVTTLANAFDQEKIKISSIDSPREDEIVVSSDVFDDKSAKLRSADFAGIDASEKSISSTLMNDSVFGSFDSTSGTQSSWVLLFPTKRAHMDKRVAGTPVVPFNDSVVTVAPVSYNEEEGTVIPGTELSKFSPFIAPSVPPTTLPYELNVITFDQNPLSSLLNTKIDPSFGKGWLQLGFTKTLPYEGALNGNASKSIPATHTTVVYNGLPAVGFEYIENSGFVASSRLRYTKNVTTK